MHRESKTPAGYANNIKGALNGIVTGFKKAAIEQSLFDVDSLITDAREACALGRCDDAISIYKQALSSLEDRYRGEIEKIPVDVLIRRYRVLLNLARTYAAADHIKPAIQSAIESSALASGPLSSFPELFLQSCVELGSYCLKSGDTAEARNVITKAAKAPRGDDEAYGQALVALGTGRLLIALGKSDLAIRGIAGGLEALKDPRNVEEISLRADLFSMIGTAHKTTNKAASAEAFRAASNLLYESACKAIDNKRIIDAVILLSKNRAIVQELPITAENNIRRIETEIKLSQLVDLRGRWEEASKLWQGILDIYQRSGVNYPRGLILARAGVGNYLMRMKQYDRAESSLQHAVQDAEQTGEIYGLCYSNYYLGLVYSKRGNDEKGFALFETALDRIKELPEGAETDHLSARLNNQLGFIEAKQSRQDSALTFYRRTVDILKDAPNDTALGEAYRLKGDIYTERGQNKQGERVLKKALDIFEKVGATFEIARTYKSLGLNFLVAGDMDKAAFFLDESIKILERLGIESELPVAYSNRAKVSFMKEEYTEAETLYTKDFNIAKKSDNKHSLAFSYYNLGRTRRMLTRTHSAEDLLQRSLALFNEVKNDNMAGHVMIELAMCAAARKDIKSATDLCAKSQSIYEAKRNSPELAELLLTRGIILRDAKRIQMAQRCFEDCIRMQEKLNLSTLETAETLYEFALFWRDQGKRKEAAENLVAAIGIAEKLGLSKRMNRFISLLNEIDSEASAKIQLSRFVDKATVEQISKGKSSAALTAVERKNLTVLFTDIRDFTTISETLELDALASFLDDFYTNVIQVVNKFGGMLNKFIGDAALAIFNLDGATTDHPAAAVRAAVDLVRTINEVNLMRKKRGEMEINIGVGVNTGEVVLGSFGSSLRQDFTAIGDTVNTASRLQAQASHGEIVVSQGVYNFVRDFVVAEDMGEKPLKGKGQPLRLWKIVEIKE